MKISKKRKTWKKLLSVLILTMILCMVTKIPAKAGEAAEYTKGAGTPGDPHIFTTLSWGGGEGTNNGFYVPSSSNSYQYFRITTPSQGGYIRTECMTKYWRTSDGSTEYWAAGTHYVKGNQEMLIAFPSGKNANIALHEHWKGMIRYERDGDICKKISYCSCGYEDDPNAYSVTNGKHDFSVSGKVHTCKNCNYSYTETTTQKGSTAKKVTGLKVTRYSKKSVHIVFKAADDNNTDYDIRYEIYANGKKIKTLGYAYSWYGSYNRDYTYKAKNAGYKKYYVKTVSLVNKTNAKSATVKPKANKKKAKSKFSYSKYPSSYGTMANTWRPTSISKNGKKYTVKGFFISNHILKLSNIKMKVKVMYYPKDGSPSRVIATKTINSGKMKPEKIKKNTFKVKSSKTFDWNNGGIGFSCELVNWKY